MNNVIEIKNLKVSFKGNNKSPVNIIRGVDLIIPEGEIVGIVGETLSGKTVLGKSLINLNNNSLLHFDKYQISGDEIVCGKKVNLKNYRGEYISYIPKSSINSMNPTRKIGKQLLDVVNKFKKESFAKTRQSHENAHTDTRTTKNKKYDYIVELLTTLQIINPESIFNLYPHEVSTDIKERLTIAISLIAGSKLIILDDVTSQLDTTMQSSMLQLIKKVNQEFKVSFLLLTSNIFIAAKMCAYIYVLYAGKIVEKATRNELLSNPKHPYTWALFESASMIRDEDLKLNPIPGNPPDMNNLLSGDPFAPRNRFAVEIDFIKEPPLFEVTNTHHAATWMLHPLYPHFEMPREVSKIIKGFNGVPIIDNKLNENKVDSIDDKIVESSYLEEMFTSEPKIKFDVNDVKEPVENENIQDEVYNSIDGSLEEINGQVEATSENNEIKNELTEPTNDISNDNQFSEDEIKKMLSRQAKMHKKIKEKITKQKKQ